MKCQISTIKRQMKKETRERRATVRYTGLHAGGRHASLVQDEVVKLAATGTQQSSREDARPRADRRHVDSPRLLFSLTLFSCSCSNRTVNNNNSRKGERQLPAGPHS